jgi:hypothetical protein
MGHGHHGASPSNTMAVAGDRHSQTKAKPAGDLDTDPRLLLSKRPAPRGQSEGNPFVSLLHDAYPCRVTAAHTA